MCGRSFQRPVLKMAYDVQVPGPPSWMDFRASSRI